MHARFFNPNDSSYVNGYPAYLAIALLVDLPPMDQRPAVWARLEREILQNHNGHIWSGIIGGGVLFETLLDARRDDLIYTMATKTDYPSWTQMLADGSADTLRRTSYYCYLIGELSHNVLRLLTNS